MKKLTRLTASIALATAGFFCAANAGADTAKPSRDLAGIELGSTLDQAKAIIAKDFPDYAHVELPVLEDEGVKFVTHVWRKTDPNAKTFREQSIDDISVFTIEGERVAQVSRFQRADPANTFKEAALLKATSEKFGGKPKEERSKYHWVDGDRNNAVNAPLCAVGRSDVIGIPGLNGTPARFKNETDVYIQARLLQSFNEGCDFRAELDFRTNNDGLVQWYTVSISDDKAILDAYRVANEKTQKEVEAASTGAPKL